MLLSSWSVSRSKRNRKLILVLVIGSDILTSSEST